MQVGLVCSETKGVALWSTLQRAMSTLLTWLLGVRASYRAATGLAMLPAAVPGLSTFEPVGESDWLSGAADISAGTPS